MKTEVLIDQKNENILLFGKLFDYTKWREQSLDEELSVRELSKKAMVYSKRYGNHR